jgi:17beta-estradiol 17-dehydrogenase / very-long-chain 3-oxoacyl-CoA reductase
VINALAAVGAYTLSKATLSSWRWLYLQTIARADLSQYGAYRGCYVLITGASDGIGKALALEGAAHGFHLILIARTESKLQAVKEEINRLYPGIDVILLTLDCASEAQDDVIEQILSTVQGLNVSIVWNNVGVTTSTPLALSHIPNKEIRRILRVNNTFTMTLTARLIPLLQESVRLRRKTRPGKET